MIRGRPAETIDWEIMVLQCNSDDAVQTATQTPANPTAVKNRVVETVLSKPCCQNRVVNTVLSKLCCQNRVFKTVLSKTVLSKPCCKNRVVKTVLSKTVLSKPYCQHRVVKTVLSKPCCQNLHIGIDRLRAEMCVMFVHTPKVKVARIECL